MLFFPFVFSEDEFEVDPLSLKSIINSEGMTPVRVTAPVRKTLAGPFFRQVSRFPLLLYLNNKMLRGGDFLWVWRLQLLQKNVNNPTLSNHPHWRYMYFPLLYSLCGHFLFWCLLSLILGEAVYLWCHNQLEIPLCVRSSETVRVPTRDQDRQAQGRGW